MTSKTNYRPHTKSIHALNPSSIKSMTPKANKNLFSSNFNNQLNSTFRTSQNNYKSENNRKNGIVQALFTDQIVVLNKLKR